MRLTARRPAGDAGSALMTALLSTLVMLALGLALLAVVDTQASQSATERTRDRAFNLSESVLTSGAFVLGRNWPASTSAGNTITAPLERNCSDAAAGVGTALGTTATSGTAAALLQPNLNASYYTTTGDVAAYQGATWQYNVCDNTGGAVWSNTLLTDGTKNWDKNGDNKLWLRAQATVAGRTRAVAGLVQVRPQPVLQSKYGLVSGNVSEDISSTLSTVTNQSVVSGLTSGLLNQSPPVLADPAVPLPNSGVTGLRCGLLNDVDLQKTCVTGTIGALSNVPLINTLVTNGSYTQFGSATSTDDGTIGQLRAQAKGSGTYTGQSAGGSPVSGSFAAIPACTITGTPNVKTVVFIESVGTGDQYCVVDVSTSKRWKALVIGSGRVIIRGSGSTTTYTEPSPASGDPTLTTPNNLFAGVIYALNKQTSDLSSSTPTRELVRIEKGARVRGGVNADGKNAVVSIVPPDFDTTALVNGLLCPGLLCSLAPTLLGLTGALGLNGTINALINGTCLVSLPLLGCTVQLPGLGATAVLGGLLGQLSSYGSAIRSNVDAINALTVYGASGVLPGTFRDLNPTG